MEDPFERRHHSESCLANLLRNNNGNSCTRSSNHLRFLMELPGVFELFMPICSTVGTLFTPCLIPDSKPLYLASIILKIQGLQNEIKLVPIDLQDKPTWHKEKIHPENKVPSLEHNGKVLAESLDLIKYVDANFEGPSLEATDPAKKEFGDQLIVYVDTFTKEVFSSFRGGDHVQLSSASFDNLENALGKFDDGPFFLGQFSLVDIAFITFVERFQIVFTELYKHDITAGRPKLAAWIEELNKFDAYKQTKVEPEVFFNVFKKHFSGRP
ncbi:hypothetical protein L6164_033605 [Bauhinia variegata]|uniref:Uncharacterized protein n=1 Tax=Bauhinia variegata TaxID=167791 RepID=A0ACB9KSE0_BAUVA|nr:hypothetical protein L6164_033605 [Bauhinia variegata]